MSQEYAHHTNRTISAGLIRLFHHRWALPVIAEIDRARGARFVTLTHRFGISKESLNRTLEALTEAGLVMRNPGYGHPLRPEYVLTEQGAALGPASGTLAEKLVRCGILEVGLLKWSMPLTLSVARGNERFVEIRDSLPGSTPRALTLAIEQAQPAGLVRALARRGERGAMYTPGSRVRGLVGPLEELSAAVDAIELGR